MSQNLLLNLLEQLWNLSKSKVARLIMLLMLSALLVLVPVLVLNNLLAVELKFNQEGTSVLMRGNEPSKAIVLLPANKLWLNTGLAVKSGQQLKISATGSINLAVHRLVAATKAHQPLEPGWMDPNGNQGTSSRNIDEQRKKYLIDPNSEYGVLIAGIVHQGKPDLGKDNPKADEIYVVGKWNSFRSKEGGTLWLVVNDAVLNENAGEIYVGSQKLLDQSYPPPGSVTVEKKRQEWQAIKERRYFQAYFDDNVGDFLVQIEFLK
jgi:hypothetical protein